VGGIREAAERLHEAVEALMRGDKTWHALARRCADPLLAEGERTDDATLLSWADVLRSGTAAQCQFALLAALSTVRVMERKAAQTSADSASNADAVA
jgi:hypothetical protein